MGTTIMLMPLAPLLADRSPPGRPKATEPPWGAATREAAECGGSTSVLTARVNQSQRMPEVMKTFSPSMT